ncbi:MAG TPA: peptide ABC transporter substrate-binding protein [Patescibacteria group bacterium]|nr:peptide ABC transporter substrate-binding protein [Patescibacteria group bacterium]
MRKKVWVYLLVLVFAAGALAGCGSSGGGKTPNKTLRITTGAEPETLDPRKAIGVPEGNVMKQIFEGLCNVDAKGSIVPGVAERWEVAPDAMKFTFYLRANAKWSNGDPVTAQDFEYAWKTLLSPELGSRYAEQLFCIKNAQQYNKGETSADQVGIRALNDRTLEVVLEKPTTYFLSLTTFWTYYPLCKKVVESNDKWNTDVNTLIGNGPFKAAEWVHNSKITLVKNENYWQKDVVKLDKVEFYLVENQKTILDMFENNQLDVSQVPPPLAEMPRLQKENKLKILPEVGVYHYMFNVTKPPFDNVKVRKAMALAIDRTKIIDTITKGGEKAALAWAPLGLPDVKAGEDFRKVGGDFFKDNDVETAKKLLAEAGYPDGKGLPPITMLYNTSDIHKVIAEALQEMWKKNLGITVSLVNQEWKVYLQARYQGDFMMARRGWLGDYLDPMTAMETMLGDNKNNNTRWKNPEYDKLIRQAQVTLEPAQRMKLMHDAEKILMEEMPFVPIYFSTTKLYERPNVKGIIRDAMSSVYLREASVE